MGKSMHEARTGHNFNKIDAQPHLQTCAKEYDEVRAQQSMVFFRIILPEAVDLSRGVFSAKLF